MKPYSLRRRLVVVMVAALTVVLALVAGFLYVAVRESAWQQHDDNLLAHAHALAAIAEHDEEGYEMQLPPQPASRPPSYIEVFTPGGDLLARSPAVPEVPVGGPAGYIAPLENQSAPLGQIRNGRSAILRDAKWRGERHDPELFDLTLPDGRPGRAVVTHFLPRDESGNAGNLSLLLAEGVDDVTRAMERVRDLFLVFGAIAVSAIALLVWWLVGSALQPLDRLAVRISLIDDRSLATRLPVDGQPAELVAPVRKLNELLGRLETSFTRERQFTADVSHELRTPLAGLRTVLEVTALADRTSAEYRTALADAHAITLQLAALVDNLLMLARLDAGQLAVTPTDVDLHDLVADCWKPHAALAASRNLTFKNEVRATTLSIDREKLRVILGNLLANAAEYTEAGGWIEVQSGDALLAVADSGPALPDTAKIFDRLWRGDAARTGTGVHCGIGLALAKSLAEHMALSLTAANQSDGSVRFAISRI